MAVRPPSKKRLQWVHPMQGRLFLRVNQIVRATESPARRRFFRFRTLCLDLIVDLVAGAGANALAAFRIATSLGDLTEVAAGGRRYRPNSAGLDRRPVGGTIRCCV